MAVEVKQYDPKVEQRTVVDNPTVEERREPYSNLLVMQVAETAQAITPWGVSPNIRDRQLRSFWHSEPWLASVVYSVSIRNASFKWEVIGSDPEKNQPKNTIRAVNRVLKNSNRGKGWIDLITQTCIDLYTVDNGAVWEIIRTKDRPDAPVINIAHLDSLQCLSGDSRILFEDGSTMSIREVVRHKYGGYVMSMSSEGVLEPKRITSFYENKLGDRHWLQIRLKSPKRSYGKSEQLTLTNDHEILTAVGWKRVEDVLVGDYVATDYKDLSTPQLELFIGTMLGDAGMRPKSKYTSSLMFSHAKKQEEWLKVKQNALNDFGWSNISVSYRNICSSTSHSHPIFGELRDIFYPKDKKIVPLDMVKEHMSPRLLAAWYLDDGNKQKGKWGRAKGRLYTNGFTKQETESLVEILNDYGIACNVHKTKKHKVKGKSYGPYFYIYITSDGFEELCKQIAPYVPPSMRYKLSDEISNEIEYDPSLWRLSSEAFYDEVVSIDSTDNGKQTAAFCIDVEDNHNFVASGIVVHNCTRTGDPEYPVIYRDRFGREKVLRWWQVRTIEEFPSPVESALGLQYSAVSRCLLAAEIIQSIAVYKMEKVSGRFTKALDIVSGVTQRNIDDALGLAEEQSLNKMLYRYSLPVILPGIDPTTSLSHIHIDLASLPDNFDEDTSFKWYVAQLAAAFGVDYQEIAPLMTGNLGSSQQSEIMHLKTRGKGPALIMSKFEDLINGGLIPSNVEFRFMEQDIRSEREKAETTFTRAKARAMMIKSGELTIQGARELAVKAGDIPRYLAEEMENEGTTNPEMPTDEFGPNQVGGGMDTQMTMQDVKTLRKAISKSPVDFLQQYKASFGQPSCTVISPVFNGLGNGFNKVHNELMAKYANSRARFLPESDYHVTLVYSPLADEMEMKVLDQYVNQLVNEFPLQITCSRLSYFDTDNGQAIVMLVDENDQFKMMQRLIYDKFEGMGIPVSDYSKPTNWKPHITLAYVQDGAQEEVINPVRMTLTEPIFTRSAYKNIRDDSPEVEEYDD